MSVRHNGGEKTRCTVVLAIAESGDKLPPVVIFKRKTVPKVRVKQNAYSIHSQTVHSV